MDTTSRSTPAAPEAEAGSRFEDLNLDESLLRAVRAEGYTTPTPIQVKAIPPALAGRDVLGCAQTGTGKTAAFALPILQRLGPSRAGATRPIRVLVLSPTRELAAQIAESFTVYGRHTGLTNAVIFGGVGQDAQARMLRRGVDVLVATPGRLLDLMGQRLVSFGSLEVFVLDEADRMLDMGFLPDVRRIIQAIPAKRQTLFFSATMPPDIRALADTILRDPVEVAVTPIASTAETVVQSVYFVDKTSKPQLLRHVLRDPALTRVLVFSRTKHGANRIAEQLDRGGISAEAIHGNKSQNARERALAGFKTGRTRVLVATDIAARGIDIDALSHVVNYDLPNIPESYVHRIGRTGRAGAAGVAISFCDTEEREFLIDIERLIRAHVPRVEDHPFAVMPPPATDLDPRNRHRPAASSGGSRSRSGGGGGGGNRGRDGNKGRGSRDGYGSRDGHAHPNPNRTAEGAPSHPNAARPQPSVSHARPAAQGSRGPRPPANTSGPRPAATHGSSSHGSSSHGSSAHGSNAHGSNAHGSNAHGSNAHGSNAHGSNAHGSNAHGSNAHGSNAHGSNAHGSNAHGSNAHGSNAHGSSSYGSNSHTSSTQGSSSYGSNSHTSSTQGSNARPATQARPAEGGSQPRSSGGHSGQARPAPHDSAPSWPARDWKRSRRP